MNNAETPTPVSTETMCAASPATARGFLARWTTWRLRHRARALSRTSREEPLRAAFFRQVIFVCGGALVVQGVLLILAGLSWRDLVWTTFEPGVLLVLAAWFSRRRRGIVATSLLLVGLCHAAAFTQARFAEFAVLGVLLALTIPLAGMLMGAAFVGIWTLICTGVMAVVLALGQAGLSGTWKDIAAWTAVYVAMAWLIALFSRHLERLHEATLLAGEQRQQAITDERTRFARDIHDSLAQGFTGIVMQLNAAEQRLSDRDSAARGHLDKARQLARECLEDARRSVSALRSETFDGDDFARAVEQVASKLTVPADILLNCVVSGQPSALPEAARTQLLRIVQEAVTNVVRHSGAGRVRVSVNHEVGAMTLEVEDDGSGIQGSRTAGYGIRGMRERAEGIGASFSLEGGQNGGTRVRVVYPHA